MLAPSDLIDSATPTDADDTGTGHQLVASAESAVESLGQKYLSALALAHDRQQDNLMLQARLAQRDARIADLEAHLLSRDMRVRSPSLSPLEPTNVTMQRLAESVYPEPPATPVCPPLVPGE